MYKSGKILILSGFGPQFLKSENGVDVGFYPVLSDLDNPDSITSTEKQKIYLEFFYVHVEKIQYALNFL